MIQQIRKNAALNVLGVVLPTLVGIVVVPMLLHNLGADRLGIFTLALGLIGFAGIFDLGLGRALTQTVAKATGQGRSLLAIACHVRRTLPLVLLMGMAWAAVLWMAAEPLAVNVFRLKDTLAKEAALGIRWLAVAIPGLLLTTSLVGVLEGLQKFALVNVLRVPLGILAYLMPALASFGWQDVGQVIAALVIVRLAGLAVWLMALARVIPLFAMDTEEQLDGGAMWRFTGWLTVSNIVSPLMVHADRFYLASVFPPATIAHYTVPLDTLSRATSLPVAAMNAVFPALAHVGPSSVDTGRIIHGAAWLMLTLWAIPIIVVGFNLEWLLTLWLGNEFASQSLHISQWLLLGVMTNGFAHIPYAMLQSAGRADLTAKLHMTELAVYAVLIVLLVAKFGIVGAALAWTTRIALDTAMLYGLARVHFPALRRQLILAAGMVAGAAFTLFIINFV